ncbi:MAG: UDP-3-O-(3-hydroxymyristoyl)glucosamine N-acyltransferase [Deltaproteobacteria bacterium]|nr:UDP-3-O-(3-hydroxymyristoyl)glucosamine N-acyltransferase [Deltaproteobacteria bacterium]
MTIAAEPIQLKRLAEKLGCSLEGDGELLIHGVAPLNEAKPNELSFVRSEEFVQELKDSQPGAVVAPHGIDLGSLPVIRSDNPGLDFGRAVGLIHSRPVPAPGIHPSAFVDSSASVDPSASIGPCAVVGAGCVVGARTQLHANVTLYDNVKVGEDTVFYSGVSVGTGAEIGSRVVLQSGVKVGDEGFGFVFDEAGHWERTPHVGAIVLEDDVEIGTNSTVARGTLGETRIGRGSKIDALVLIAHNCKLGEDVLMAGHSALAGSVTIERRAIIMGQAGIIGHVTIGEGAFVGGRCGVAGDVRPGARVWGAPEMEERGFFRATRHFAKLGEYVKRIRAIEKYIGIGKEAEQLKAKQEKTEATTPPAKSE